MAMFAPRRLGKTYFLQNRLQVEAAEHGFTAVFCDLQGEDSCEGAVLEIVRSIQASNTNKENLLERVKAKWNDLVDGKASGSFSELISQSNWKTLLEVVLENLNDSENQYFILLDEVTVCLTHILARNEADGRMFFNRLRKVRHKYPNVRWLLTGSIGIDALADEHDMDGAINDLEPVIMEPLTPEQAQAFALHISQYCTASEFTFESNAIALLLRRLGWLSPFYIEKLCRLMSPTQSGDSEVPVAIEADIEAACDKILLHPHNRAFKGWLDHLDRNIEDKLKPACKLILDFLCTAENGESADSIRHQAGPQFSTDTLKTARIRLMNDGYLVEHKDKYSFALPLLANYWEKYEL